jgi:hypothetical protein
MTEPLGTVDYFRYYEAGVEAAWKSLDPRDPRKCVRAWREFDDSTLTPSQQSLVVFSWGWRWAADRFKDEWRDKFPDERGCDMAELWR